MLLHISDNPRRVTVVSFPRDMIVPIPSCTGEDGRQYSAMSAQMLNVSYMYGGLSCSVLTIKKPVIAAVNGIAAGGGFVLSMMCDLRFMAADASVTTRPGRVLVVDRSDLVRELADELTRHGSEAVAAVADEHEGGDVSRALRAALQVLAR